MDTLSVLVDYDNLDNVTRAPGPVGAAKAILARLPANLLFPYTAIAVRLYGGWRTSIGLTTVAQQQLVPDIRANSPTVHGTTYIGQTKSLRVRVELAVAPVGTKHPFPDTLVRDRDLRFFRARPHPWGGCAREQSCGMSLLCSSTAQTRCQIAGCGVQLNDIFVRDEQKMVDTLIVADIAQQALVAKEQEIVVVSSDADIWPGIFLALQNACRITHVHTSPGWKTPRALIDTLSHPMSQNYRELSL